MSGVLRVRVSRPRAAVVAGVLAAGLTTASSAGAASSFAPAAPPGWSAPTPVTGSSGVSAHVFATAPDGTDAVVWIAPGSQVRWQLRARVRVAGSTAWTKVPVALDNTDITEPALTATPDGQFWLAFTSRAARPEVYVMRLDPRAGRWSGQTRVWHQDGYGHQSPRIAVAGNGAVVVGAVAKSDFGGHYRAVVSVRERGSDQWRGRFLTDLAVQAGRVSVGAGTSGDLAVAWVEGTQAASMRVRIAARAAAQASAWGFGTLGGPGDGQLTSAPSVAEDGSVALAWVATATTTNQVRVATGHAGQETWATGTAQPAGAGVSQVAVVAASDARATVLWRQAAPGGRFLVQARSFQDPTFEPTVALTPAGEDGSIAAVARRTDGAVVLVTHQHDLAGQDQGLRYRLLTGDIAGPLVALTDGTDGEDVVGLGLSATGLATVAYARGLAPSSLDVASFGELYGAPAVTASALRATPVTAAKVTGTPRVGQRVRCTTGFWVESAKPAFSWLRDGRTITGAHAAAYRLVTADRGHRVSCRAVGRNDVGTTRLASPGRRVR